MRLVIAQGSLVLLAVLAGCGGSAQGEASTAAKPQAEISDFDKPMDLSTPAAKTFETPAADTPLLGARQDLTFAGSPTAKCQCLAVVVGQPANSAFKWAGERPHTNKENQLVIALSSAGIACPQAGDKPTGASYWGYESVGNDVVVVVERASQGRPTASGAIIPHPIGNGQVYVRSLDKKVPYGGSLSGAGDRCQVGMGASSNGAPMISKDQL